MEQIAGMWGRANMKRIDEYLEWLSNIDWKKELPKAEFQEPEENDSYCPRCGFNLDEHDPS